jgi:hypothetical protein
MLLQLSTPFAIGLTKSSSHAVVLYNWFISSRSKQVASTNLSPFEGSNGARNLYLPDSKVIFIVFRFIIVCLSNSHSNPSNDG